MAAIEVGRVCVKTRGREAGSKCVVVDLIDKNFVLVTGPKELNGVRRRRTNIAHLEAISDKLEVKKGASDEEVMRVLKRGKKLDELKEKVAPTIAPAA